MDPKEGFCEDNLEDGQHCGCWWDCYPCCSCGFDGGGEDCDCPRHNPSLYDESGMLRNEEQ
jgi:hypothetical protein